MRRAVILIAMLAASRAAGSEVRELDLSGWVLLGKANSPVLAQYQADVMASEAAVRSKPVSRSGA